MPNVIKLHIPEPYAVHVPVQQEIQVPVYKIVPEITERKIPYTVEKPYPVEIEKPYPVEVIKHIKIPVPKPYAVPYTIYKHVLHKQHGWWGSSTGRWEIEGRIVLSLVELDESIKIVGIAVAKHVFLMWKVREFICKLRFENKYNCYRFIQESKLSLNFMLTTLSLNLN